MTTAFRRRKVRIAAVVLLVPVLAVLGFGIYLASLTDSLPWQTQPTRISQGFAPFSGIPGFATPTRIPIRAASPRATPASVAAT